MNQEGKFSELSMATFAANKRARCILECVAKCSAAPATLERIASSYGGDGNALVSPLERYKYFVTGTLFRE